MFFVRPPSPSIECFMPPLDNSVQYDNTLESFLKIFTDESLLRHIPVPRDVRKMNYSDLNYSVRIAVVLKVTRDIGVPFNFEDFQTAVNGRKTLEGVFEFIRCKVEIDRQATTAKSILTQDLRDVTSAKLNNLVAVADMSDIKN